jgi:O-antigen chain-terminating methyltransferase
MQTIHSQFDSFEERLGATQALLNETEQQLRASMTRISALVQENAERAAGEFQSIRSELHKIEYSQTLLSELGQRGKTDVTFLKNELIRGKTDVTFLKNELILQKAHLTRFLESINGRSTEAFNLSAIQSLTEFGKHSSDALYVAFEDQFRGTREDIKQRISAYLPIIAEAGVGMTDSPILDLGCGHGGCSVASGLRFVARGVDLNQVMVSLCRERGFDVAEKRFAKST